MGISRGGDFFTILTLDGLSFALQFHVERRAELAWIQLRGWLL
jgi:hypothetical protein